MDYSKLFNESELTYTDIAHELGCCELTARNKINGKTRLTKAEQFMLDNLFGGKNECSILKHNH